MLLAFGHAKKKTKKGTNEAGFWGKFQITAYTQRLRPKRVAFQALGIWKSRDFTCWSIWKVREMSFRSVKSLRRANTDALVEKQLWYCNLFIFYKDCVFIAVERDTKF